MKELENQVYDFQKQLKENELTIEHLRGLLSVKDEEISFLTHRLKKYLAMVETGQ
jgi:hypothetical protein